MSKSRPPRNPLILRFGVEVFRRLSKDDSPPVAPDAVHILNATEQARLKTIERAAIFRAAWIGVLSAIICGFSWFAAEWILGPSSAEATFWDARWHYAIMMGLVSFATGIEIVLLYWNALVAVHRMAVAAGLQMFAENGQPNTILNALTKVALELPNSRKTTLFAQPGREVSRFWVVLAAVLYRLKVTATYYIIKAIVQRFLGRVMVKWMVELVAIPIFALWDAMITFWVLRQARVCAIGPSAVVDYISQIHETHPNLTAECRIALLCSVGSIVARNPHLHPNVELLLRELADLYGMPENTQIDDSANLLDLIGRLEPDQQEIILQTLTVAIIIDGKASIWEKRLLQSCLRICGKPTDLSDLTAALKRFRHGEPIGLQPIFGERP